MGRLLDSDAVKKALDDAVDNISLGYYAVYGIGENEIEGIIDSVPSAEPEIIYCKDCKYYTTEIGDSGFALGFCPFVNSHIVMSKGFCAWAERRTNE